MQSYRIYVKVAGGNMRPLFVGRECAERALKDMESSGLIQKNNDSQGKVDMETARHVIDELVGAVRKYRQSESYKKFIDFIGRFRFYSSFNAMLIHIQMPGASFVASVSRWQQEYGRGLKPDARPLVILQPMGPVMFVFDVSDTVVGPDSKPLPPEVENPFLVLCGYVNGELDRTIENAKRDGIRILMRKEGACSAGSIRIANEKDLPPLSVYNGKDTKGNKIYVNVPVRYELLVNDSLSQEARYCTVAHELAHLYCGHLGTVNTKWWGDRRGLSKDVVEFEAESVAYMICKRMNIDNPSEKYLVYFLNHNNEIPDISLDCIIKVVGLIEQMGRERLKMRKA